MRSGSAQGSPVQLIYGLKRTKKQPDLWADDAPQLTITAPLVSCTAGRPQAGGKLNWCRHRTCAWHWQLHQILPYPRHRMVLTSLSTFGAGRRPNFAVKPRSRSGAAERRKGALGPVRISKQRTRTKDENLLDSSGNARDHTSLHLNCRTPWISSAHHPQLFRTPMRHILHQRQPVHHLSIPRLYLVAFASG